MSKFTCQSNLTTTINDLSIPPHPKDVGDHAIKDKILIYKFQQSQFYDLRFKCQ